MTKYNISVKDLFWRTCWSFPEFTNKQILKWLEIFLVRYFTRAYKKNCYGDGLQIFDFCVSPNYYHVPSDINNHIWMDELQELKDGYAE